MKNVSLEDSLFSIKARIKDTLPFEMRGEVVQSTGILIESLGPKVPVGHLVSIQHAGLRPVTAQVVGFRDHRLILMPLENGSSISNGDWVMPLHEAMRVPVGVELQGRVIDALGNPIDGKGPLRCGYAWGLHQEPPSPMQRQKIKKASATGVRALDAFTPLGVGQRMGIFAGSGVGKSTLLGMIARASDFPINVICLVGERGRELREFIDNDLGPQGLARSVVVVSTSDQSAALRIRAAFLATRIAEAFREEGGDVLLMMDSVTRFAMAQREVGLAVGEPPTSRGYTPSVFAALPRLLERSGTGSRGSITGIYTVLVDADDMNDPIADAVRGILDGHIVLSRALANANHFPAIDVLESISRLGRVLLPEEVFQSVAKARDLLALYKKNEDLINLGAYQKGTSIHIDKAIQKYPLLMDFMAQKAEEKAEYSQTLQRIMTLVQ
jgi:flagellum-specific ATP synthase